MTEIVSTQDLDAFFRKTEAVLYFHAPWSEFAVISKQMVELVERRVGMKGEELPFFWGVFEGERVPMAEALVAAGVPGTVAFTGKGSLSFFREGRHCHTLPSVVAEGTEAIWRLLEEHRGKASAT